MQHSTSQLKIRHAQVTDVESMTPLAHQLGYPTDTVSLARRFEVVKQTPHSVIMVAELADTEGVRIVGFAHFRKHTSFVATPTLEVAALVTDESVRGQGIGKRLMAEAEVFAKEWGLNVIRLSSNLIRTEAHQFYRNLGFEQMKTSLLFVRKI